MEGNEATEKQVRYIKALCKEAGVKMPGNVEGFTKVEASRVIDDLLEKRAERAGKPAPVNQVRLGLAAKLVSQAWTTGKKKPSTKKGAEEWLCDVEHMYGLLGQAETGREEGGRMKAATTASRDSVLIGGEPQAYRRRRGGVRELDLWLKPKFVNMWNSKATQNEVARHFGISVPTVKRLRKRYCLEPKHSAKHPARRKQDKSIRRLYRKGYSTVQVARVKHMADETVRKRLKRMGVKLRKKDSRNVLYSYSAYQSVKARNGLTPKKIRVAIKEKHEEYGYRPYRMAREIGVDYSTIRKRIEQMGLRKQPIP